MTADSHPVPKTSPAPPEGLRLTHGGFVAVTRRRVPSPFKNDIGFVFGAMTFVVVPTLLYLLFELSLFSGIAIALVPTALAMAWRPRDRIVRSMLLLEGSRLQFDEAHITVGAGTKVIEIGKELVLTDARGESLSVLLEDETMRRWVATALITRIASLSGAPTDEERRAAARLRALEERAADH